MKRLLRIAVPGLLALLCIACIAVWLSLRASLPRRSGAAVLEGLGGDVTLEFDARGIPRILAQALDDAFAAQGFVHAQDRYFQMDLSRRSASGELAALLGTAAIGFDTQRRALQLRSRAAGILETLPRRHREHLERYAAGVNAGLADLGSRPPEYLLLRQAPQPWRPEDSILVAFALYTMLSNNDSLELHNGALRELLPQAVFEFMTPSSAREDRPLAARSDADTSGGYEPMPVPGPESIDLRRTTYDGSADFVRQPLAPNGSNNWAIVGGPVGDQALLGNDPHLSLRVPNVFHRAELYWDDAVQRGVGIAGLPGILIGANDFVGWGATVSYADQADYVVIDVDPSDTSRYLTRAGAEPFGTPRESIAVAGPTTPVDVEIRTTRWGPVVGEDFAGRPLALRATWLDPDGFDFGLLDLAHAQSSAEAIEILQRWRGP
ncbi:MAG TPA: penicillin acylase family protein, partial [Gammaproteobacteria bacterium]|nr:penicillin acylase family protein [Gammaproteobacteria bacterium]